MAERQGSAVAPSGARQRRRAETAADQIARLASETAPGERLGSRADLQRSCDVSVGTLHEALRLLQATGEITVRTGPGGGVFAGDASPLSELLRSGGAHDPVTFGEAAAVLNAVAPLVVSAAIGAMDDAARARLRARLASLEAATDASLRDFVRATLELFATLVAIPPGGMARIVASAVMRVQIGALAQIDGPIDPEWREVVDEHARAARRFVDALVSGDLDAALAIREEPGFVALFVRVSRTWVGAPTPRLAR
ncbi:GntR family transcriptional regulator [Demequina salsinemoris]|uniref:GntR family transcriptional regulator n=1 Tax=Demequina salsinemoris TaxID=577470 RepID=UPI00078204A3|nr:GntR family transcriptional regulator [Demequina salsinemoris]